MGKVLESLPNEKLLDYPLYYNSETFPFFIGGNMNDEADYEIKRRVKERMDRIEKEAIEREREMRGRGGVMKKSGGFGRRMRRFKNQ